MSETVVSTATEALHHFIHDCLQGTILLIINSWAYLLFIGAADCKSCMLYFPNMEIQVIAVVMMILRVWVMYNRSRLILGLLLAPFSVEIISTILNATIHSNPKHVQGMYTRVR